MPASGTRNPMKSGSASVPIDLALRTGSRPSPTLVPRARLKVWPGPRAPQPVAPVVRGARRAVCSTPRSSGRMAESWGEFDRWRLSSPVARAWTFTRRRSSPASDGSSPTAASTSRSAPYLRHHDRRAARTGRLAGRPRRRPGRPGIDRGLLEAGVQPPGGPLLAAGGQRPAHQAGPRAQDRREGLPVDRPVAPARPAAAQLRPAAADPRCAT